VKRILNKGSITKKPEKCIIYLYSHIYIATVEGTVVATIIASQLIRGFDLLDSGFFCPGMGWGSRTVL
jgi:hypothetical protein